MAALTLAGTSVHCGGRVDSVDANGHGDGRGANGAGTGGAGGSGSSGSGSGQSGGGGATNGGHDGGAGEPGGPSGAGGTGSGGEWRSGRPWPLSTGGVPEPPPHLRGAERIKELGKLRMDEDLSVLAPEDCPTTFSLDWDAGRDGTIDATEQRIFDARGRLVAAEMTGTLPGPGNVRMRLLIEYDGEGRPTQHLYGSVGTRAIQGHLPVCDLHDGADTRGSVIDVTYASSGKVEATIVYNGDCTGAELDGWSQALELDERHRLVRRYAASFSTAEPGAYVYDERVGFDEAGRVRTHVFTGPSTSRAIVPELQYEYLTADTVQLSSVGRVDDKAVKVDVLTRTLDPSGRVTVEVRDVGSDGTTDATLTRAFDGDDCGYETSIDYGNDGLVDVTSRTTCKGGRVTSVRDRSMLSAEVIDRYAFDATLAPPQGTAAVDIDYDPAGNVLTRTYETTSAADGAEPTYDRGTFTYSDGFGDSGRVERELEMLRHDWGGGEHSNAACRVERTCAGAPRTAVEGALARCELGAGMPKAPVIFRRVTSMYFPTTSETGLWLLDDVPLNRAHYQNLIEPVRSAVCCDGCGAELSCVNNGR